MSKLFHVETTAAPEGDMRKEEGVAEIKGAMVRQYTVDNSRFTAISTHGGHLDGGRENYLISTVCDNFWSIA